MNIILNKFCYFSKEKIELNAIVIEYSLPSSSYATMALRELLKDE